MRTDVLPPVRQPRGAPARRHASAHAIINSIQTVAETIVGGIIAIGPLFWLALVVAYCAVRFGVVR
jgi:hypothetical protein